MEVDSTVNGNDDAVCKDLPSGGINDIDSTPHASVPTGTANQAGSSFSPLPDATTYEEQLSKMEGRDLAVADKEFAIARLRDLNYYRLRGYWLTLERDDSFVEGASFDDVWELYQLDRELRMWLWRAIAPIEIKLRTQFAYHFAHLCGAGAYLDAENYRSRSRFEKALSNFERERDRSRDQGVPCVVHNMAKYGKLPVWAAVECMSLGTLSMLYGNLDPSTGANEGSKGVIAAVADAFGTKSYYLKSWVHHLTTVRNIAAHHDRFYNRVMAICPSLLKRDERCIRRRDANKQFPTFLVIRRIYEKSWPEEWESLRSELASCIDRHPSVDLSPMGFPKDWRGALGIA